MIPKQLFGRTGHESSQIIFGAYALSKATQAEADKILEVLLAHGVNHIDTAPMYGNAEKCVGAWMKKHRDDFFLATKSRSRDYESAIRISMNHWNSRTRLKNRCIGQWVYWEVLSSRRVICSLSPKCWMQQKIISSDHPMTKWKNL